MFHVKGESICLLCHMGVQPDDIVIALSSDEQKLLRSRYKDKFCMKEICGRCYLRRDAKSYCIHDECHRYRRRFFPNSPLRLCQLLQLWPEGLEFLTQRNESRQRHAYKVYFANIFSQLIENEEDGFRSFLLLMRQKLPNDLLLYIADFSWPCDLQRPAMIISEEPSLVEFWRNGNSNHESILDYAGELVCTTSLSFLGRSYVTSITLGGCTNEETQGNLVVTILRNEIGVYDIGFEGKFGDSRPGSWYRLIRTCTGHAKLRIQTKNIITDVRLANTEELVWNPYWDHPPDCLPGVSQWFISPHNSSTEFMRYAPISKKTRGIICRSTLDGIVSIRTYTDDDNNDPKTTRSRSGDSDYTVDLYFPLERDEHIIAAWIRDLNNDSASVRCSLVLQTSLQRICTFGYHVGRDRQHLYRYEPLLKDAHRITGFCYNDQGMLSSGEKRFGVTKEVSSLGPLPDLPSPAILPTPDSPLYQWFMSSGSFIGVQHVQLCVDTKQANRPTIGMLLIHSDREEYLGQWRDDCEIEDLSLKERLCFFSGEKNHCSYTKVSCSDEVPEGWMEIPSRAQVVWWFKPRCSYLCILSG